MIPQTAVPAQTKIALARQAQAHRDIIPEIRSEFNAPAASAPRKQHRPENNINCGKRQNGKNQQFYGKHMYRLSPEYVFSMKIYVPDAEFIHRINSVGHIFRYKLFYEITDSSNP